MIKFYVYDKQHKKVLGILTDEEIDKMHLDIRCHDIIPVDQHTRQQRLVPTSILEVFRQVADGEKEKENDEFILFDSKRFKKEYFPIFQPKDLDKVYITASGHFMLRESLSEQQLAWIQAELEGKAIFG